MPDPRPSREQRGYGLVHERLRRHWAQLIADPRNVVRCPRCLRRIRATHEWHLGHRDGSRTEYNGPEHALCNLKARQNYYNGRRTPEPHPNRRHG
jgi:hypothetical protein